MREDNERNVYSIFFLLSFLYARKDRFLKQFASESTKDSKSLSRRQRGKIDLLKRSIKKNGVFKFYNVCKRRSGEKDRGLL